MEAFFLRTDTSQTPCKPYFLISLLAVNNFMLLDTIYVFCFCFYFPCYADYPLIFILYFFSVFKLSFKVYIFIEHNMIIQYIYVTYQTCHYHNDQTSHHHSPLLKHFSVLGTFKLLCRSLENVKLCDSYSLHFPSLCCSLPRLDVNLHQFFKCFAYLNLPAD